MGGVKAEDVLIVEGARTAWAEYAGTPGCGAFRDLTAVELAAHAARAAMRKAGVDARLFDHCVMGNALQTGPDGIYGARHAALRAGLPIEAGALTVNRLCGSGIEAVAQAARMIRAGEATWVLAGGMESMSQAPHAARGLRGEGLRFGRDLKLVDTLFESLNDPFCGLFMAETSDRLARKYAISRAAQDEYALRSHREGARSSKEGIFREEIVPVPVKRKGQEVSFESDDHLKPETTLEKLASLSPAFGKEGTVTAGNASGIVDGACCLVVAPAGRAKEAGARPIGRIVSSAVVGVPPETMGIGPAPAIRAALGRAGLDLSEIDLFEINEAFAGQYLAVEKELELDRSKSNVNGGSIALGHPLGATGARLLLTLLYELRRRKKRLGVASACIGGGQGIAMIVEAQ
jgi:acetyl-CoA acetyltransferase family protein